MNHTKTQTPRTVTLQGSEYTKVPARITDFHAAHPNGGILTEIVRHDENEIAVMSKAVVYTDGNIEIKGIGNAFRTYQGNDRTDNTSKGRILEKCETAAVGRALAMAGFPGAEVASAEEMEGVLDDPVVVPPANNDNSPEMEGVLDDPVVEMPPQDRWGNLRQPSAVAVTRRKGQLKEISALRIEKGWSASALRSWWISPNGLQRPELEHELKIIDHDSLGVLVNGKHEKIESASTREALARLFSNQELEATLKELANEADPVVG